MFHLNPALIIPFSQLFQKHDSVVKAITKVSQIKHSKNLLMLQWHFELQKMFPENVVHGQIRVQIMTEKF